MYVDYFEPPWREHKYTSVKYNIVTLLFPEGNVDKDIYIYIYNSKIHTWQIQMLYEACTT